MQKGLDCNKRLRCALLSCCLMILTSKLLFALFLIFLTPEERWISENLQRHFSIPLSWYYICFQNFDIDIIVFISLRPIHHILSFSLELNNSTDIEFFSPMQRMIYFRFYFVNVFSLIHKKNNTDDEYKTKITSTLQFSTF